MESPEQDVRPNRRHVLGSAAAATLLHSIHSTAFGATPDSSEQRRRLKQSIVHWCFGSRGDQWSVERTCQVAKQLGYQSVELVGPEHFATLKAHGLTCAIVGARISPGPAYMRGFNNPSFRPMVLQATRDAIDAAAAHGYPNVIAFTGFSAVDPDDPQGSQISLEEGAAHCVDGFKQIVGYAENKNVTICLEMLNSRDNSDPMKGHPGYQGDHTDYCIDIIKRVGSPRLKLLFDIYHVQIMDGDVIRRLRQYHDLIGHVHTAGVPGRGELDDDQEVNYSAVMRALADLGYQGFVGQEFIPTRDPVEGLKQAFEVCNV